MRAVRRNKPSSYETRLCFHMKNEYSTKVHVGQTCLSGKPMRESALTPTGGNSLGSGPCLKCLSDSYWDYWHLRCSISNDHDQTTTAR